MEQSSTQSSLARVFLKIARFIGIYLLGIFILYALAKAGVVDKFTENPLLALALVLLAPLVWALSKDFIKGFVRYIAVLFIAWLIPFPSYNGRKPYAISADQEESSSSSYIGRYSGDDNGVQVKIVVAPNKWYGEIIEGTTGSLISSEGGDVNDRSLYDQYGTAIGEIRGDEITLSIQGQRIRLKKD